MLGVLPFVEDPDLSWTAGPAVPQHLPPWLWWWVEAIPQADWSHCFVVILFHCFIAPLFFCLDSLIVSLFHCFIVMAELWWWDGAIHQGDWSCPRDLRTTQLHRHFYQDNSYLRSFQVCFFSQNTDALRHLWLVWHYSIYSTVHSIHTTKNSDRGSFHMSERSHGLKVL